MAFAAGIPPSSDGARPVSPSIVQPVHMDGGTSERHPGFIGGRERIAPALGDPSPDDRLTKRELEVLEMMAEGATNPEIAERLVITVSTVKTHVRNILRKMHVRNRTEAVAQYLRGRPGDAAHLRHLPREYEPTPFGGCGIAGAATIVRVRRS
jgi:DNA-binding NarL/FixJ family response regulator